MTEFFLQYGLFLAKSITIVLAIVFVVVFIFSFASRGKEKEKIEIKKLNDKYDEMRHTLQLEILPKKDLKKVFKVDKQK